MVQSANRQAVPLLSSFFCILLLLVQPALADDSRIALVIGNGAYTNVTPLPNATHDSRAIAASLERLGFEVFDGVDLDRREMKRLIQQFTRKLQNADVGLFYYAGHGLQFDKENYLIPIDATKLEDDIALSFETVPLKLVVDKLNRGAKTKLIILDACRDNPLTRSLARGMGPSRSTATSRGLARIQEGNETFIAFATKPDDVAQDGPAGKHSPFTSALLAYIERPGMELRDLMAKVRRQVINSTNNQQQPWETSSLTEKFFFKPERPQVEITVPTDSSGTGSRSSNWEIRYWEEIKTIRDPEAKSAALKRFVVQYPNSVLVFIAQQEIAKLDTQLREQREREKLLQDCQRSLDYDRLTEATTCYKQIQQKDRGNEAALQGLKRVISLYASRAENALKQDLYDQAELYLKRIEEINPDARQLLKLRAALKKHASRPSAETETPTPTSEQEEAALGLSRSQRLAIQKALTALGYSTKGADGIFGKNTRAAIRSYQQKREYRATGYLTELQWQRLTKEAAPKLEELRKAQQQRQAALEAARSPRTGSGSSTTSSKTEQKTAKERRETRWEAEQRRFEETMKRREAELDAEAKRRQAEVEAAEEQKLISKQAQQKEPTFLDSLYEIGDEAEKEYERWQQGFPP